MPAVSVVFPIMLLTFLVHMIPPPALQLNSRSSAQCLTADYYIGFYQLMDVGSVMPVRVVPDLITEAAQMGGGGRLSAVDRSLS